MSASQGTTGVIPERWLVLAVQCDHTDASDVLVDQLLTLGARGVEERGNEFIAHLPPPDRPDDYVGGIGQLLRDATGLEDMTLTWSWQLHEDWASTWKQGLAPRKLTDRLIVSPSWCEDDANLLAGEGAVVIVIDPGMAFGTAEHGTTRGALRLLDRALVPGESLLDAGCGSAILAIAAAKIGAADVVAVDLDPYATAAAVENAELNGVEDAVVVKTEPVTPDWLAEQGRFDGVLANIQTAILIPLLPSFAASLAPSGWLILSGILAEEWGTIQEEAAKAGFSLVDKDSDGEWRSGWFELPPA